MSSIAITLRRDAQGRLCFTGLDRADVPVTLTPAFPLSEPDLWLSLRSADGAELALIEDPASCAPETRLLIDEELRLRQFIPVMTRVHRASSTTTGLEIHADTDRGPTTIVLDADEHIRRISDTRLVLTDRAGVRYLIPDLRELDAPSRQRLERFI